MIRIVTLSEFPPDVVDFVSRRLHAAYGMGSELEGEGEIPARLDDEQSAYDAVKALEEMDDDVALYATTRSSTSLPSRSPRPRGPWAGARWTATRSMGPAKAIATSHGLADKGVPLESDLPSGPPHYVGHLWDLHHCYDPGARCTRGGRRFARIPRWRCASSAARRASGRSSLGLRRALFAALVAIGVDRCCSISRSLFPGSRPRTAGLASAHQARVGRSPGAARARAVPDLP